MKSKSSASGASDGRQPGSGPTEVTDGLASASQRVLAELERGFRDGRYAPGQRLVAGDLAADLGMSRAPVREAFHILAGRGVLELTPNRGVRIRELGARHMIDMLQLLKVTSALGMELAVPKIAADRKLKSAFRGEAKRLAEVAKKRRPYEWFLAIDDFHNKIDSLSGNLYLSTALSQLHLTFFHRALGQRLPGPHWSKYAANYAEIAAAVAGGLTQESVRLFTAHMDGVIALLEVDSPSGEG